MSEFIHVETSSTKQTLTMHLNPEQDSVLINALTGYETCKPGPAAKELMSALYAIRDGKTILINNYTHD